MEENKTVRVRDEKNTDVDDKPGYASSRKTCVQEI